MQGMEAAVSAPSKSAPGARTSSTLSAQQRVSRTAYDCAAARALTYAETKCESFDYLAGEMVRGASGALKTRVLVRLMQRGVLGLPKAAMSRVSPGVDIFMFARTAIPDDLAREVLDRDSAAQVVLLGAGLETSGLRIGAERQRAGKRPGAFFEVDLAATQAEKRLQVNRVLRDHPSLSDDHIIYVPCSFGENELDTALEAAGFDASKTTVWVWSGVVHYLTDAAVRSTVAALKRLSSPGSMLFFDFILLEAYDRPNAYRFTKIKARFDAYGEVMSFGFREGTEHVTEWLADQGLKFVRSYTHLDMVELYERKTEMIASSIGTPWSNLCIAKF